MATTTSVLESEVGPEESGMLNIAALEEATLAYWSKIGAFKKSLELNAGKPEYTFYDGPPFATGLPHYGHILAGTIKDTVTRYAHQTGHHVSRRFGWDCHGLPVEYEIDKTLGLTSRDQVLAMGIDKYNGHCRGIVRRYTSEWETVVTRLGRWIDFENDYRTMDATFMESVWWVFKTLHDKGLVYKGYKVMPYSTACTTPLSNFEAGLNYKDCKDPAVVVSFPMLGDADGASLVAWTTTPWTLPSNLALCVNPDLEYCKVKSKADGRVFVLATARLEQVFPALRLSGKKKKDPSTVYERLGQPFLGAKLVGTRYEPLFDFLVRPGAGAEAGEEVSKRARLAERAFRVVADGYVTSDAGTGVVHQAPAFGEDDYRVCVANDIVTREDVPCPVDANGRFEPPVDHPDLVGKHVKEADPAVIALLKAANRLVVNEQVDHSYPFCWRSDTPLIYRAVPSIFVRVEQLRDKLLANNAKTYWVPATVKEKRFHNWLAEAKDWAISRNRFWGTPIPLFESADGKVAVAVGSVDDLLRLKPTRRGQPVDSFPDLHREFLDDLVLTTPDGVELRRVDEVFDCWFESGSMPYAQIHYPFEGPKEADFLQKRFPADFIAEGVDQTRGWFYTLTVIATALYDRPAFKNLIVNGIVLAEDGRKMSKRLKNYPDPTLVMNAHGADALRLYLINSPVVKGDTLRFSQDGVKQVLRDVMLPWFNAFRFFSQQAARWEAKQQPNATDGDDDDQFHTPDPAPAAAGAKPKARALFRDRDAAFKSTNVTDLWVLAALDDLTSFVHAEMQAYRLYTVVPRLVNFLGDLTNWYVRLNRTRLKGGDGDESTKTALAVLLEVLLHMARLMAPFTPFFAELLYQRLRRRLPEFANRASLPADALGAADSVHFVELPRVTGHGAEGDRALRGVRLLQSAVELGRKAREQAKINMKTPVRQVVLVLTSDEDRDALDTVHNYVLSELNTWGLDATRDVDKWCTLSADPKLPEFAMAFKQVLGKQTKAAQAAVRQLDSNALRTLLSGQSKTLPLTVGEHTLDLTTEHLIVKTSFAADNDDMKDFVAQTSNDGALTVAVNVKQDDDLRKQGIAREVVNRVNKLRKKAQLSLGHFVDVFYHDQDQAALPTDQALAANAQLLAKANIRPLPIAHRSCHALELASDIAPTPFGSKNLLVAICKPTPTLSTAAAEAALKKRGARGAQALESLVSTATPQNTLLRGLLDGEPFELELGVDFFMDATSKVAALSTNGGAR